MWELVERRTSEGGYPQDQVMGGQAVLTSLSQTPWGLGPFSVKPSKWTDPTTLPQSRVNQTSPLSSLQSHCQLHSVLQWTTYNKVGISGSIKSFQSFMPFPFSCPKPTGIRIKGESASKSASFGRNTMWWNIDRWRDKFFLVKPCHFLQCNLSSQKIPNKLFKVSPSFTQRHFMWVDCAPLTIRPTLTNWVL